MQLRPTLRRLPLGIADVRAAFAALMLLVGIAPASAQTITTVAGGAVCDNASALAVSVAPGGTAVDAAGNLYVAALTSHAVCKVTPGGTISVFAGTGTSGFSGDGGAATSAQLNYPNHVVFDGSGNLYISDSSNYRVRKVTPAGIISTFAGGGFGGDGSLATSAYLNFPSGLAFDSGGNLYISEPPSHRIRKITAADGKISTIAGTGTAGYSGDGAAAASAQLNSPYGIALDGAGNVYVADRFNHRLRKITAADGKIATIAGTGMQTFSGDGGPATAATFNLPHAVAVDAAGNNIYVADWQNHRVRKITTADGKIATIAGTGSPNFSGDNGPAAAAQLNLPNALSLDAAGNLFVSDYNNFRVRKIAAANASIATVAGNGAPGWSGDGSAATAAQLGAYLHVAADAGGNLYISDSENHRIRKVATNGTISTFAGNGTQGFSGDGGAATSAQLNSPGGIAFDGAGNLYIAEQLGQRVRKVATNGTISTFAGNGGSGFSGDGGLATAASLAFPTGVATDTAGNVYIADTNNHRIRKVGSDGKINTVAGNGTQGYAGDNGAAIDAQLNGPSAIKVDRTGNLVIADTSNHRVRKVGADGKITTIAGNGTQGYNGDGGAATDAQLLLPSGLAFNPLGELNIADWYTNSVRKIAANGVIDRIAGSAGGNRGFGGDNGPAIDALLSSPYDIAFDAAGNLYIADGANRRIRKVASPYPPGPTSLLVNAFGTYTVGDSVTITVTMSTPYAPTGTVDVCLDGDPDPDFFCWPHFTFPCSGLPLSPGANPGEYVATCTTSTLPVGDQHSIGALYSGDGLNLRSTAGNLGNVTITSKAATSIAITGVTPGYVYIGQSTNIKSSLTVQPPGTGTPTGTITVSDGEVSCSYSTPANDNCSITPVSLGGKTITLTYSGDDHFAASTKTWQYLQVSPYATCGADNGQTLLAAPAQLCSTGNPSAITGSGHPWSWYCGGTVGFGLTTCSATIKTWTVTAAAGANGSITPPSQTVDHGKPTTLTVTPQSGYSAQVSGCGGSLNGATYTTAAITADCAITATFSADPVAGACGADNGQTLLAAPAQLCSAGNASVVGGSGHPWSWTCAGTNGGGNATCSATIKTWTVTAAAGANGSITPPSQTVDHGKPATLTVTPQSGYTAQASGCGGSLSGANYTTAAITADCAVTASFSAVPRTATTTTLSLAPNPATTNQAVTATLGVSGGSAPTGASLRPTANASPAAVTGTVVVSGGGQQCTATLNGTGAGSCTLSYAMPGSYAITANYSGDAQNAPSSASTNLVVNAAAPPAAAVAAPALSWWALLGLIATLALYARRAIARR